MSIEKIRNLSKEELLVKQRNLKQELFKLNLQRYGGRVEKPHMFSIIRKDLARIKSVLREQELKEKKQV
ncbi:MAG: 50S ribosomal protein L29 [Candidatus Omnitrophica bacterium]|nr:50S ribosomal protein L29 [Candidatus Omnitrophota bacterium]MBU1906013.1 50S ribosomal protein L29 [Candidatus Omnitrophota bacterium]